MNTPASRGAPAVLSQIPATGEVKVIKSIRKFIRHDDGVTAVEYSVLAVLIISAIVLATTAFSTGLTSAFNAIGTKITAAKLG